MLELAPVGQLKESKSLQIPHVAYIYPFNKQFEYSEIIFSCFKVFQGSLTGITDIFFEECLKSFLGKQINNNY